jgi:hypothetical protein
MLETNTVAASRPTELVRGARQPAGLTLWLCLGSAVVSVGLRVLYLSQQWRIDLPEHPASLAAEGLVGLMARHILGGERPIFYYGQSYMGALEGYLAAVLFRIFGASMAMLRTVPAVFAVSWIPLTAAIATRLHSRRVGFLAATLIALPSQFVFSWGFQARGGHAEHVTMVLLTLYLVILELQRPTRMRLAALGFVAGFSLWINQLAIVYMPVYGYALVSWLGIRRKQVALVLGAAVIGLLPLIYGNIVEPLGTARVMAAKVRATWGFNARLAEQSDGGEARFYRSVPLFQVLGAQPRRDGSWSAAGTATALLLTLGSLAGSWHAYRRRREEPAAFRHCMLVLAGVAMTLVVGIGGFFGQPVGRYQLVLYPLLAVLAAGWLDRTVPRLGVLIIGLIAVAQAMQIAAPTPSDGRTPREAVIQALIDHGLRNGYGADYMYDIVFVAGERILIEPLEWTRYAPYKAAVAASDDVFYIYRDDQEGKIAHRVFMAYLDHAGVHYDRFDVGEYHVLYDFAPPGRITGQVIAHMGDEIRDRKGQRPSRRAKP